MELIGDEAAEPVFSVASIWEVAIKSARGRPDFDLDAYVFRSRLLQAGFGELVVTGEHAVAVTHLPYLHRDPFDRILLAQARVEGLTLLTVDQRLSEYGAPVRRV